MLRMEQLPSFWELSGSPHAGSYQAGLQDHLRSAPRCRGPRLSDRAVAYCPVTLAPGPEPRQEAMTGHQPPGHRKGASGDPPKPRATGPGPLSLRPGEAACHWQPAMICRCELAPGRSAVPRRQAPASAHDSTERTRQPATAIR